MSRWHIATDSGALACRPNAPAPAFALTVSRADFTGRIASDQCQRCAATLRPRVERYRYRVDNTAGELIGTVTAKDDGEAAREADRRFGAGAGQHVRRRGG